MKRIRTLLNSVYIIPVSYSLFGLLLAFFVIYIDVRHIVELDFLPSFLMTEGDLARSIFSSLVGALLTMTTVSFSTIMVVLTLYSAQFTPRITRDFLERRAPLRVLGLFMASFIFSIISLYALGQMDGTWAMLSPFIGVVLAIGCLGAFAYFIYHVARSVQINYIIDRIAADITQSVKRSITAIESTPNIKHHLQDDAPKCSEEPVLSVPIAEPGFVTSIAHEQLLEMAAEHDLMLYLKTRLGDLLEEEDIIVDVHTYASKSLTDPESLAEDIQSAFTCGEERNFEQDVEFGITKLVEVALRAISPGINDPNTANYCIMKLGPICRIIGRELENIYYYDDEMVPRIHVQNIVFRRLLYQTYHQLRTYGQHDISVVAALIDSISDIAEGNHRVATHDLWQMADYILHGLGPLAPLDREFINQKIRKLARLLSRNPDDLIIPETKEEKPS